MTAKKNGQDKVVIILQLDLVHYPWSYALLMLVMFWSAVRLVFMHTKLSACLDASFFPMQLDLEKGMMDCLYAKCKLIAPLFCCQLSF